MTLHGSQIDQTIGIGINKDMTVSDSELGRVTATGRLTVGSSTTANVHVAGVTDGSSDQLGFIQFLATKDTMKVVFENSASTFNKGLTIQAIGGIVLSESVTTKNSDLLLFAGTGSLTIVAKKSLSTTNQLLTITADDADVASSATITTGTSAIFVAPTTSNRTLGLGTTADLTLSDSELGQFSTEIGLILGDSSAGSISVGGIRDSSSDSMELLTLRATKAGRTVNFVSASSSFNKGIVVQANGGIVVSQSVTLQASTTHLHAGTGTITIASATALETTSQLLMLTADDIDIDGSGSIDVQQSFIQIWPHRQTTQIAFGSAEAEMQISASELARVSAAGVTIDSSMIGSGIILGNVTEIASGGINGILTLLATADDLQVGFESYGSTFHTLDVLADNGITVFADVTTTTGALHLDADADDSSTADGANGIVFASGRTITSATVLTLEATTSTMVAEGSVTLIGQTGIVILNSLLSTFNNSTTNTSIARTFTIDANIGVLTLASGRIISCTGDLVIDATEFDIQGSLRSEQSIVVPGNQGDSIGLGSTNAVLALGKTEFQRMVSNGLVVGSANTPEILLANVTAEDSLSVNGIMTFVTQLPNAPIIFQTASSTFSAVSAQSGDGIDIFVDITTYEGNLILNGDTNNFADGDDQLTLTGSRTLTAAQALVLDSTNGGILRDSAISLLAGSGVTINNDLTSSTSHQPVVINADNEADGRGVLLLNGTALIDTANGELTISASDIEIGQMTTGTAVTRIHVTRDGVTMGLGMATKDLTIDGAELQRITSSGMEFGNEAAGSITVDGVLFDNTATISGVFSIAATGQARQVIFEGSISTFKGLSVRADNGVTMNTGTVTKEEGLLIDGDSDDNALGDRKDRIVIWEGTTLEAASLMQLDSTSGGINPGGSLTLKANSGIAINDGISFESGKSGELKFNADMDIDGDGTLSLRAGMSVTSGGADIIISAADLDLGGSLTAIAGAMSLVATGANRTIWLGGNLSGDGFYLTDTELSSITCTGGLTIGASTSGEITVNGLQDGSSAHIGLLTLVATGASVLFTGEASNFNKGITVTAAGAVTLSTTVTTKQSQTLITSSNFTIAAHQNLTTHDQFLVLTADDMNLLSQASVDSGTAAMVLVTRSARGISLGTQPTAATLQLDGDELQLVKASGLTIGSAGANTGIRVVGIAAEDSSGVVGVVSLVATVDDSQVTFDYAGSVFSALAVQADNGVLVKQEVKTVSADLYLDGDAENDGAGDAFNSIGFTDGRELSSHRRLTLESTLGSIQRAGSLTLRAGAGISLLNELISLTAEQPLVINADYESGGDGTLTVAAARVVDSNDGAVLITATDIDLQGGLISGKGTTTLHSALESGVMSLGDASGSFAMSSSELQRVTSLGLYVGRVSTASIVVAGVAAEDSAYLESIVTLAVNRDDGRITFNGGDSVFNRLSVQADNGIQVDASLTSDIAHLFLDSDAENSSTADSDNAITTTGSHKLSAQTTLTLMGMVIREAPAGALTLHSYGGIVLHDSIQSSTSGQAIIIEAADVITIKPAATVHTGDGALILDMTEINLLGNVTTGTGATTITTVAPAGTHRGTGDGDDADTRVGLGDSVYSLTLSGSELQRITSNGLTLGSLDNQHMEISGVTRTHSAPVTGVLTLLTTRGHQTISFANTASTFNALDALADDGIDITVDLTSETGSILLDGDADEHDDGTFRDHIKFNPDRTIRSEKDITLKAKSGGIKVAGALTLIAKGSIYIENEFDGPYGDHEVITTPDSDGDGVGVLDIAAGACENHLDCGSCASSKLCGWCGHEPGLCAGKGLVSVTGTTGDEMTGYQTEFTSQFSAGWLLTVAGNSRIVAAVNSDTRLQLDAKLSTVGTGSMSVYAPRLDLVYGAADTSFLSELIVGNSVFIDGVSYEVASIDSDARLTTTMPISSSGSNLQFWLHGIKGDGTISGTAPGTIELSGSWPPVQTRFTTQIEAGHQLTVNGVSRTVVSVESDQKLTLDTAFPFEFTHAEYTISGILGTGSATVTAGSAVVTGVSGARRTTFTRELRVGDLVTVEGQTKMVQLILSDQLMKVSDFFSTGLTNQTFVTAAIHDESFSIARNTTGAATSTADVVIGSGTKFGEEFQIGYSIAALVEGTGPDAQYEYRAILEIQSDTAMVLDAAFSVDITDATAVFSMPCASGSSALEPNADPYKSYSFHAKTGVAPTCYSSGRCVPKSSHDVSFEEPGTGTITSASPFSTEIVGQSTTFTTEFSALKLVAGVSLSMNYQGYQESRRVVSVETNSKLVIESPFSFVVTPGVPVSYIVRPKLALGTVTQSLSNNTVVGTGTAFTRVLRPGFLVALGDQHRVVTAVHSDTEMAINAPFATNGVLAPSVWTFEACTGSSSNLPSNTYKTTSCTLYPGCCGSQMVGTISQGEIAMFTLTPDHPHQQLRVELTSASAQMELVARIEYPPDHDTFDHQAAGSSPAIISLPGSALHSKTLWLGVRGLPQAGAAQYELAIFLEFDFTSFACDAPSVAWNETLATKCAAIGLHQVGGATVVNEEGALQSAVLRLSTAALAPMHGAVWHQPPVHILDGFQTSFTFRISTVGMDGFAFVIAGGDTTDAVGCGGPALGFASDEAEGCTSGITNSFAIEFDTWHDVRFRDVNQRGQSGSHYNASSVDLRQYSHVAFFSNGDAAHTADHRYQLAGTPAVPDFNDGEVHSARVVYVPGRIFLYIDDMQSFVLTAPLKLLPKGQCIVESRTERCVLDEFGNAQLGFTSSTRSEYPANHDIHSWSYCSQPNCGR
jgi:hypothetical protein